MIPSLVQIIGATDKILSSAAIYAPLAVLVISILYSPELTTKGGVQCVHKDAPDVFYMNNYCWEHLSDKGVNHTNGKHLNAQVFTFNEENFHKKFPFILQGDTF